MTTRQRNGRCGITACMLGLVASVGLGASTLHVASAGSNESPYDTWAKAATDLKAAVDLANTYNNGSTVLVSNGTYTVTAEIPINNTAVRGFGGQREAVVVDGGAATRPFHLNHASAVLADLTVSNGLAASGSLSGNGGGVYLNVAGSLLTNCVVTHCTAAGSAGGVFLNKGVVRGCLIACNTANGTAARTVGGIQVNSDMQIFDCVVSNNTALNTASAIGGVYLVTRSVISNSTVFGNTGVGAGGVGTYYYALLAHCKILGNSASNATANADSGGGVGTSYSSTLRNCLVADNVCRAVYRGAGGVRGVKQNSDSGRLAIEGSTVVSNAYYKIGTSGIGAGGVFLSGSNYMSGCIVYTNTSTTGSTWYDVGINSADRFNTNNYVNNCVRYATYVLPPHLGNIKDDPRFAAPGSGNYRLTKLSPCINAGTNLSWMADARDLDGNPRIDALNGSVPDIGAYEFTVGPPPGTALVIR